MSLEVGRDAQRGGLIYQGELTSLGLRGGRRCSRRSRLPGTGQELECDGPSDTSSSSELLGFYK